MIYNSGGHFLPEGRGLETHASAVVQHTSNPETRFKPTEQETEWDSCFGGDASFVLLPVKESRYFSFPFSTPVTVG